MVIGGIAVIDSPTQRPQLPAVRVEGQRVAEERLGAGRVAQDAEGLDPLGVGRRRTVGLDHPAQSVDRLARPAQAGGLPFELAPPPSGFSDNA